MDTMTSAGPVLRQMLASSSPGPNDGASRIRRSYQAFGKRLSNHTVDEEAELESVTRSPIVTGRSIGSVRLQPRQFEGLECQRVTKKSEEIFLIR